MEMRALVFSVLLLALAVAGAPTGDDISAVPFPSSAIAFNATRWRGRFPNTGRVYNASLAIFDPRKLSIALRADGCVQHAPVSATAKGARCLYATNAGFFDFPPHAACEGNLFLGGQMKQFLSGSLANIAVNGSHVIAGYFANGSTAGAARPASLVSGRGWLVRGGAQYVNSSREFPSPTTDGFVKEWAPRTGAGVRADGAGMLLTIDGIEGTSQAAGGSLWEFADLLAQLGAVQAVNLDGGGSTTAFFNGTVFNEPHCADSWTVCERDVTTITCVSD
jgi:N-acetylglucosamine-1-phosphodiester alpha-N-acetylglucosaminidase